MHGVPHSQQAGHGNDGAPQRLRWRGWQPESDRGADSPMVTLS